MTQNSVHAVDDGLSREGRKLQTIFFGNTTLRLSLGVSTFFVLYPSHIVALNVRQSHEDRSNFKENPTKELLRKQTHTNDFFYIFLQ